MAVRGDRAGGCPYREAWDVMQLTDLPRGRPLRVLQITDTHLYGDGGQLAGVDTEAAWEAVVAALRGKEQRCDLLLHTGDVIHDGALDTDAAYCEARRQLQGLGLPGLVVPGNHDDAGAMERVFHTGPVRLVGHLVAADWLFITLDSTVPGATHGHLSATQLQWLDDCLGANDGRHVLVGLHHHPVPVGCRWIDRIGLDNGRDLFDVLDRHDAVRAVVWGHVHQEFDGWHGDIRLLASPSTCVQFDPASPTFRIDPRPPGYRWLELQPDGRVRTGVERLTELPAGLDVGIAGY